MNSNLKNDYLFAEPREDVNSFPIGCNTAPIGIIWIEDGEMKFKYIESWSKGRARNVAEFIKELKRDKINFKVIGTWPGQWKSNMFNFDPDTFLLQLELYTK